jgi:hypothetical protein
MFSNRSILIQDFEQSNISNFLFPISVTSQEIQILLYFINRIILCFT